jgi:hypothetical protein
MRTLSLILPALLSFGSLGGLHAEAAPARSAVVVELFTSQGCSSCPPADRLLTELGDKTGGELEGVEVIPLSYHVDYWNYIGWTDPFSAGEWSLRQRRYAARFASDTVYTPQVVVDGRSECVGSKRGEVKRRVLDAASRPAAGTVELHLASADDLLLEISARLGAGAPGAADLLVAVFETGLETAVGSGENARRTLHNDYVVRTLAPAGRLEPGQGTTARHRLEIDPAWRRDRLGVAVFLQSPETLEIFGATSLRL